MATAVLAHDAFGTGHAKTAEALLRYGEDPVVAVIDRSSPGIEADKVVGEVGACVPVVASTGEALELEPDRLFVGIAPVGGGLPETFRPELVEALSAGVDVVSGLHAYLADDEEMAAAASAGGATITDVRRPPPGRPIYTAEVLSADATIVLTVGTDCSAGKMTTSVELVRELSRRGTRAAFVATGQTGIMVGCASGVVIDAVGADFVAGWSERIVLEAIERTDAQVVLVEGQGALSHPAYGSVSLGLLFGSSPHGAVLCHDRSRTDKTCDFHAGRTFPVLGPAEEWQLNLAMASTVRAPELVGIAAMNGAPDEDDLERLGRPPVCDVLGDGPGILADAIEAML